MLFILDYKILYVSCPLVLRDAFKKNLTNVIWGGSRGSKYYIV